MNRERIPVGVVGVGFAGQRHAEKYAASSKANLMAVVDIDGGRSREVGEKLGVAYLTDYRQLFGHLKSQTDIFPLLPGGYPVRQNTFRRNDVGQEQGRFQYPYPLSLQFIGYSPE